MITANPAGKPMDIDAFAKKVKDCLGRIVIASMDASD